MKFEADTDQMQRSVQQMRSILSNISGNKDRMYAAITELDGMWRGSAHDAFMTQYQFDNAKMEQLIKEINLVFGDIDQARQAYVNCENSVKSMINAIDI